MRKIIFQNMVSLDGYFEGPNRELDWHLVDDDFNDYAADLLDSVDTLIFGRVTYQLMAGYWPSPEALTNDPVIAAKMNSLQKVIFSRTLTQAGWSNTRLAQADPVTEIQRLKQQPGRDMAIFGSSDLTVSLMGAGPMGAGLVDEYRIFIAPVFLGSGKTLLHGLHERLNLHLIGSRVFKSGLVLLCYKPDQKT
jgi:dihydrofolate reductase